MTRNETITKRILAGESANGIAADYGVSSNRIRQIAIEHCRLHHPALYAAARSLARKSRKFCGLVGVNDLRQANKDKAS